MNDNDNGSDDSCGWRCWRWVPEKWIVSDVGVNTHVVVVNIATPAGQGIVAHPAGGLDSDTARGGVAGGVAKTVQRYATQCRSYRTVH